MILPAAPWTALGAIAPSGFNNPVNIQAEVLNVLDDVLSLRGRAKTFNAETPLLGAVPELDSMAVVAILNAFEERFGFVVDDDDVDGRTFATVGSVVTFVAHKLDG